MVFAMSAVCIAMTRPPYQAPTSFDECHLHIVTGLGHISQRRFEEHSFDLKWMQRGIIDWKDMSESGQGNRRAAIVLPLPGIHEFMTSALASTDMADRYVNEQLGHTFSRKRPEMGNPDKFLLSMMHGRLTNKLCEVGRQLEGAMFLGNMWHGALYNTLVRSNDANGNLRMLSLKQRFGESDLSNYTIFFVSYADKPNSLFMSLHTKGGEEEDESVFLSKFFLGRWPFLTSLLHTLCNDALYTLFATPMGLALTVIVLVGLNCVKRG
jgi:hypothetical protein